MKKTYINPNMVVVTLMHIQPLAVSDPGVGLDISSNVNADDVEVRGVVSDVNVWDSEW